MVALSGTCCSACRCVVIGGWLAASSTLPWRSPALSSGTHTPPPVLSRVLCTWSSVAQGALLPCCATAAPPPMELRGASLAATPRRAAAHSPRRASLVLAAAASPPCAPASASLQPRATAGSWVAVLSLAPAHEPGWGALPAAGPPRLPCVLGLSEVSMVSAPLLATAWVHCSSCSCCSGWSACCAPGALCPPCCCCPGS